MDEIPPDDFYQKQFCLDYLLNDLRPQIGLAVRYWQPEMIAGPGHTNTLRWLWYEYFTSEKMFQRNFAYNARYKMLQGKIQGRLQFPERPAF